MNHRKVKRTMKQMCAGRFAAVVFAAGVGAECVQVKAADKPVYGTGEAGTFEYEDKIQYVEMTTAFKTTWDDDRTKAAVPSEDGYVFGGWCTKDGDTDSYTMLDQESAAAAAEADATTEVYAKFVPAYVMNVKAQVDSGTGTKGGTRETKGSIRLVSTVDSKDYQKVGFQVILKTDTGTAEVKTGENKDQPLETTKVYNKLLVSGETDVAKAKEAKDCFGSVAQFFSVWKLEGISASSDAKIMEVTPYWYTPDGTKVLGNTKYVHMEDGYESNMYVSIPVLLHEDTAGAAGIFTVTYPEGLTLIGVNPIENGNIFSGGMEYYNDETNHTIKIVANAETVNENKALDGLCVNLRFKAAATVTERLNFYIENEDFCDWAEGKLENVNAWNIQY